MHVFCYYFDNVWGKRKTWTITPSPHTNQKKKEQNMLVLDGAELSFVFLFGFSTALWTRRVFAAPSVFALLQYAFIWPTYIRDTDSNAVVQFQIAHAFVVWLGSLAGVSAGALIASKRLLHRREASLKPTLIHLSLLTLSVGSAWLYAGLRDFSPPPWPSVASGSATLLTYGLTWHMWKLDSMFMYFPGMRDLRRFVGVAVSVQILTLASYCGLDYLFLDHFNNDDATVGLALRTVVVAAIALILISARVSPCYRRLKERRVRSMASPFHMSFDHYAFNTSSSNSSNDSEKADSDYVEYASSQN